MWFMMFLIPLGAATMTLTDVGHQYRSQQECEARIEQGLAELAEDAKNMPDVGMIVSQATGKVIAVCIEHGPKEEQI